MALYTNVKLVRVRIEDGQHRPIHLITTDVGMHNFLVGIYTILRKVIVFTLK